MSDGPVCVLGAGPAAVACAHELLKAGRKVILIDPGKRFAASHNNLAEQFLKNPDPEAFVARMREMRDVLPADLQTKRMPFSSPHVYDGIERHLAADIQDAVITRTLASGGLSSMWGATVMPMTKHSFRNWPVTAEDMAPYYRSVAEIMDVPNVHDDLEKIYPSYGTAAPLALSAQAAQLMANLINHRQKLSEDGIRFGRNRAAVGPSYAVNKSGCVYCGLCMYGCPYRAIFNAEYAIEQLKTNPDFHYGDNWIAEHFEEKPNSVAVHLRHTDNGKTEVFDCRRLYIACGAATSLRLVAGALQWYDEPFHLMDTQLVSIPTLLSRRTKIGAVPQANALGQVFVEISDPEICDELIHLQVYGFNPFIADLLRTRWGKFYPGHRIMQPLYDRLMVVMGYLPGQLSGEVVMRVRPSRGSKLAAASYRGHFNERTMPVARMIGHKLREHKRQFGWWPILSRTEVPAPGSSHHLAGGMPMRKNPNPRECDSLGRPGGLKHVHLVDGACFPDLPGEHLTYTIMANAARIAAQTAKEAAA
jgi:choline dehydrogenase-like flavoprotein